MLAVGFTVLLYFSKISFSIPLFIFENFSQKRLTIYALKECVFDFDCCPSVLNWNIVEWMFKDNLACIQKFVESDNKIRVMWNAGGVVCLGCGMLGL